MGGGQVLHYALGLPQMHFTNAKTSSLKDHVGHYRFAFPRRQSMTAKAEGAAHRGCRLQGLFMAELRQLHNAMQLNTALCNAM